MTSKNLFKNPNIARSGSTRAASSRRIRFSVGTGVYSAAVEFLRDVQALRDEILSQRETQKIVQRRANEVLLRSISSFHGDPRYASGLHRAGYGVGVTCGRSRSLSATNRVRILNSRDLSKKGPPLVGWRTSCGLRARRSLCSRNNSAFAVENPP